jgi:hypothetical protein
MLFDARDDVDDVGGRERKESVFDDDPPVARSTDFRNWDLNASARRISS